MTASDPTRGEISPAFVFARCGRARVRLVAPSGVQAVLWIMGRDGDAGGRANHWRMRIGGVMTDAARGRRLGGALRVAGRLLELAAPYVEATGSRGTRARAAFRAELRLIEDAAKAEFAKNAQKPLEMREISI